MYFIETESRLKKLTRLLMLTYIMSLSYFAYVYSWATDILFMACMVCAVLHLFSNGVDRQRLFRVGFFILGMLVLLLLTYFRAPKKQDALTGSWTLIQLLAFDVMLLLVVENFEDVRRCLWAFVAGTYLMMGILLIQTSGRFLSVLPTWRFGAGLDELNVNTVGDFAGYAFVILLLLYRSERKRYCLYLMILPFLFVLASASRAAMLVIVFGIIASTAFGKTQGAVPRLILALGSIVLIYQLMKLYGLFPAFTERFDQLLGVREGVENTDGSTKARYALLLYGLEEMRKRPLLGYGAGQFKFILEAGVYLGPHNGLVQIGHAFGLAGLVFWYGNMVHAIIQTLRHTRDGAAYWTAMIGIVQIAMIISSQPMTQKTSHLFLTLLLLCSVMVKQEDNEPEAEKAVPVSGVRGYIR